ncbi:MAG: TniB family NTP-binding protein, partial [Rhodospirillales bacterium]|nr:TniB family NTP-binding protein [Rhodospirillales bacterium]
RKTGAPYASSWRLAHREEKVMGLLPNLGTRMLIIDELHNIPAGTARQRDYFLNMLKYMINDLGISIVGIGTDDVRSAVRHNPQMKSRFDEFVMPKWEVDKEYFSFLVQICKRVKLKDLSCLENPDFVRRVHTLSQGLTGGTWKLMGKLLEYADESGATALDIEMLKKFK